MAATATLQIAGTVIGLPEGGMDTIMPPPIVNANSPFLRQSLALVAGQNQIPMPAVPAPQAFLFIPPPGNAVPLDLRVLGASAGYPIAPNLPTLLALPAAPGLLVITATGAAVAGCTIVWL